MDATESRKFALNIIANAIKELEIIDHFDNYTELGKKTREKVQHIYKHYSKYLEEESTWLNGINLISKITNLFNGLKKTNKCPDWLMRAWTPTPFYPETAPIFSKKVKKHEVITDDPDPAHKSTPQSILVTAEILT